MKELGEEQRKFENPPMQIHAYSQQIHKEIFFFFFKLANPHMINFLKF